MQQTQLQQPNQIQPLTNPFQHHHHIHQSDLISQWDYQLLLMNRLIANCFPSIFSELNGLAALSARTMTLPPLLPQQQHSHQQARNAVQAPAPSAPNATYAPYSSTRHQQPSHSQQQQQPQLNVPVSAHHQVQSSAPPPPPSQQLLPAFFPLPPANQAQAVYGTNVISEPLANTILQLINGMSMRRDDYLNHPTNPAHHHHLHSSPHHHHHHHHLHSSHHHHHHHHHALNGQNGPQDDTMINISETKPKGLNKTEIEHLATYIQTNEKDSRSCVICLCKFELKSRIRSLPCSHVFHAKCVDKWLRLNRSCPICRRDALKTHEAKTKRI